jgi:pimeloyl-ACP methyl ester carboxylesterase
MATYVLVHGAYHGGWCWRDTAKKLRDYGHEVLTPTLSGLGERSHLLTPSINLSTHIQDILHVLAWEDIRDAILVGHSYGGMVITGVADRAADRLKDIVYLDAIVPQNGQSILDVQPAGRADWMKERAKENGGLAGLPPNPEVYGVTEPKAKAWVEEKCTPHPFASLSEKIQISGAPAERVRKRLYILCTDPALEYMRQFYESAVTDNGWDTMELTTGHDAMVTEPEKLSEILVSRA